MTYLARRWSQYFNMQAVRRSVYEGTNSAQYFGGRTVIWKTVKKKCPPRNLPSIPPISLSLSLKYCLLAFYQVYFQASGIDPGKDYRLQSSNVDHIKMNPTTPTPRPAHAFTGSARANRAKLVSQFQSDLRSAYVDSSTIRLYDKVSVVAFHWENDNLNVVPLETELLEVFRDQYRFDTSSYTIPIGPNVNSNTQLIRHLLDHADQSSGENTLRIYVYSGHSYDPGMISQVWNLA